MYVYTYGYTMAEKRFLALIVELNADPANLRY